MGLLEKLLRRDAPAGEVAPAQSVTATLNRPFVNQPAMGAAGLRIGMWVKTRDGVGILTGARIDGLMEVTLAKADGSTKMALSLDDKAIPHVLTLDPYAIAQAAVSDIPESRRPHIDALLPLGYARGEA
jgi:hypothetical protein